MGVYVCFIEVYVSLTSPWTPALIVPVKQRGSKGRVMLIFEDVIFPLWNHLLLCYPCHADFKTALVFKIGPILVVDVNF